MVGTIRTLAIVSAALLAAAPARGQDGMACPTRDDPEALAQRPSPLDSLTFGVDGARVKICYGRPAARGRTMIGGEAVPFGQLWRTGANEPTVIHTPIALSIAGIDVEPGTYALYSVPGEHEWVIIVNRSYSQWGRENRYTDEVKAQEVGRGSAQAEPLDEHVESFTISAEPGAIIFTWEYTRVRIPIGPVT
jgi:Protein of unknown function (DUF2911)